MIIAIIRGIEDMKDRNVCMGNEHHIIVSILLHGEWDPWKSSVH